MKLSIHAPRYPSLIPYLRRHLKSAHAILKTPLQELSLALVGDAAMSRLHKKYLGISSPTDVLTFELDHDRQGRVISGEVIVCVPQARRQAKLALRRELLLLALHGMLHLSGFDDRTNRRFAAMHQAEDRILSRLGVGKVFAAGPKERFNGSKVQKFKGKIAAVPRTLEPLNS